VTNGLRVLSHTVDIQRFKSSRSTRPADTPNFGSEFPAPVAFVRIAPLQKSLRRNSRLFEARGICNDSKFLRADAGIGRPQSGSFITVM